MQKGKDDLLNYQWNKKIAKHFFCGSCGVYTHHIRRRDPSQISINIMCVDDIFIEGPPCLAELSKQTKEEGFDGKDRFLYNYHVFVTF